MPDRVSFELSFRERQPQESASVQVDIAVDGLTIRCFVAKFGGEPQKIAEGNLSIAIVFAWNGSLRQPASGHST